MAFCPRCGAPTSPGISFCSACGESLAPAIVTSSPTSAAPVLGRPTGKVRTPGSVLLFTLITLGIYLFLYWLRVARETDAFEGRPNHAHRPMAIGLISLVVSFVAGFLVFFFALSTLFAGDSASATEREIAMGGAMMLAVVPLALGGTLGVIFWYVGQWRVWSAIRDDERRRGDPTPLSPGVQLLLTIVPYVNFVTLWIALWRTQSHLNRMWAQAAA